MERMTDKDVADAIADVFAMMGQTATLSGHTQKKSRSLQDVKTYEPKTEFGRRLKATVDEEMRKIKAARLDPSP
jgi:hypothetical protein